MKKLVLSLIILSLLTGCVETKKTDATGNEKTEFKMGEVAIINNIKVTLNSVKKIDKQCSWEYNGECQTWNTPDNDFFLIANLTIENQTEEDVIISSIMSFELKGSDSYKYDLELLLENTKSLDGTVLPGDTIRGELAYDVKDLDSYSLTFVDSLLSSPIKINFTKNEISN